VDVTIERPADAVWAYVSDAANDARWRRGIVEMTADRPGPPRPGMRVREVLRMAGRERVTDAVVTATGPGRSYRFAGVGPTGEVRGGRSVQPAGDRVSVFRYDVVVDAHDLSRPARAVLGRLLSLGLRRDVRRLRVQLERGAARDAVVAGAPAPCVAPA
jgi:hypothetical protein